MSVTRLSVPISSKMRYSLSSENDGGQEGLALLQPGQHTSTSTRPHVAKVLGVITPGSGSG